MKFSQRSAMTKCTNMYSWHQHWTGNGILSRYLVLSRADLSNMHSGHQKHKNRQSKIREGHQYKNRHSKKGEGYLELGRWLVVLRLPTIEETWRASWTRKMTYTLCDFQHWTSDIEYWILNIGHRTLDIEYRTSNIEHRTLNIEYRMIFRIPRSLPGFSLHNWCATASTTICKLRFGHNSFVAELSFAGHSRLVQELKMRI